MTNALASLRDSAALAADGVVGSSPAHSNSYYDSNSLEYSQRTAFDGAPPLLDSFIAIMTPNGIVADLGCGAGRDLARLVSAGLVCTGYDLSPELASLARMRSGAPVAVADMRSLELPLESLDGALAVASLLHLKRDEIRDVLARIAGWLRSGGILLSTMKAGRGATVDEKGRGFTYVSMPEWESMLTAAGLETAQFAASTADESISSSHHEWIATLARKL